MARLVSMKCSDGRHAVCATDACNCHCHGDKSARIGIGDAQFVGGRWAYSRDVVEPSLRW